MADVLEGDPQRTSGSGPHGHPPRRDDHYYDGYDGGASFPPADRTQEYNNIPRSWGPAEHPAGYANLPPQAAGAIRPQPGSPGSYSGSDGSYRGNDPGAGNVAASGGYGSGGRRYSDQGGGAKQGGAANEYYDPQRGFPQREPGYIYGTGHGGGRVPPDGGTYDQGSQGETDGGAGMSSFGSQQQRPMQQQRGAEGQGRTGQWQSDGISDGGYWAPC